MGLMTSLEWENVSTTAPALPTAAAIKLIFKKSTIPQTTISV